MTWEPDDTNPNAYGDAASNPDTTEGPSKRHLPGCTVLCYDAHAYFLKYQLFMIQLNVKPGNGWCDPDSPLGDGTGCSLANYTP